MSTKSKLNRLDKDIYTLLNGELCQKAFDYGKILSDDELSFLDYTAVSSNTHIGFGFSAMLATTNFILSTMGVKMLLMKKLKNWKINMNTFLMAVGSKTCASIFYIKILMVCIPELFWPI